jgi:hypothetical protein
MNLGAPHDSRTAKHWGLQTSDPQNLLDATNQFVITACHGGGRSEWSWDRVSPTPHTHIGMYEGRNPHGRPSDKPNLTKTLSSAASGYSTPSPYNATPRRLHPTNGGRNGLWRRLNPVYTSLHDE